MKKKNKREKRCEGQVYSRMAYCQCSRNGTIKEDNKWWCKSHAPSEVDKRLKERSRKWQKEWDIESKKWELETKRDRLEEKLINHCYKISNLLDIEACDYWVEYVVEEIPKAVSAHERIVMQLSSLENKDK